MAFVGWSSAAAPLTLALAAGLGPRSTPAAVAVLALTAAVTWTAVFAPPRRRVDRRAFPAEMLEPSERVQLRTCVASTSRLGSLATNALPGPLAEHLSEVHQTAVEELTDALRRTDPRRRTTGHPVPDRSPLGELVPFLQRMVDEAERLADTQRRGHLELLELSPPTRLLTEAFRTIDVGVAPRRGVSAPERGDVSAPERSDAGGGCC